MTEAALNPGGSVRPCSAAASLLASWLVKIAPNTDTPKAPPIVRKNVTPDVAAPRSAYEAVFWTAITRTCRIRPRPAPRRKK